MGVLMSVDVNADTMSLADHFVVASALWRRTRPLGIKRIVNTQLNVVSRAVNRVIRIDNLEGGSDFVLCIVGGGGTFQAIRRQLL